MIAAWGCRSGLRTNFNFYGLTLALAALREPGGQAFRKTLWRQLKARLNRSVGHRQRIVKLRGIREAAHAELVQPLKRAGTAFAADHYVD